MNTTTKYSLITGLIAVVICGSVGMFNYVVDPYALFDYENTDANRLSRIDQFSHLRTTKPWYLTKIEPTAVIVGTSRTASIHPNHSSWAGEQSYNLVVPGMTVYEMYRFIQHAQAIRPLSKLMIGLDFESFIRPEPSARPGFEDRRMAVTSSDLRSAGFLGQYISDLVNSLFSVKALSRSIAATIDHSPRSRRYFKDGSWENTSTLLTGLGGYIYTGKSLVADHGNARLDTGKNLQVLAELLRFCYQNNIDTRLFFTPTHVFLVDLWHRMGEERMWREFHRKVVALNTQIAVEAGKEPFPLWGFSNAEGIVNEPIYRGKAAAKAWFNDGVHSGVKLGRKMMSDVWGEKASAGLRLVPSNVELYLDDVTRLMKSFDQDNRKTVSDLRKKINLPESEVNL